jgi:hypothetical protein
MVGDCFDVWLGLRGGMPVWGGMLGHALPIGELGPIGSLIVSHVMNEREGEGGHTGMTTEIE